MPFDPEVFAYSVMPSSASRSRSSTATSQHFSIPAGGPGSRSKTSRSVRGLRARLGTCHCGTCSSSAARFASHTSVASSSTTTKSIVSRFIVEPGTGSVTVRTQDGVPRAAFFSKKNFASTPLG